MSIPELEGALILAAVVAAGIIIRRFTRRKLKDMDGISDVFLSGDEHIAGKF